MRKIVFVVLLVALALSVAAPAFASDACGCSCEEWCGRVRSMGYWKNDGKECNDSWMGWTFASPKGDARQIFANQAIAFRNNWVKNPCGDGVAFRETYYKAPCGKMIPMSDVKTMTTEAMCDIDEMSRTKLLRIKDMLDDINNGEGIYVCTPADS